MRDKAKGFIRKISYCMLGVVLLAGGSMESAYAAQAGTMEKYEQMDLIQGGAYVVPDENYSFQETEEELITYQAPEDGTGEDTESPAEEETEKQKAAQAARANDNATLKERQEACARALYEGMTALESRIDVAQYALTTEEFRHVISDVVNSNPELFYIRNGYKRETFALSLEDDTQIVDYCCEFYEYWDEMYQRPDTTTITRLRTELNNRRKEILNSIIVRGMTSLEKALVIHDYIITSTAYDYEAYLKYDAAAEPKKQSDYFVDGDFDVYGTLVKGQAVCQGYSLAFKYLLEAAGVDNVGFASTNSHVWNTITLDGASYYVDCTWDDPNWDTLGRVKHNYFMKSDSAFDRAGTTADRPCNGTAYDHAFWNEVNCAILYYRGSYYYIASDGNLYSTKLGSVREVAADKAMLAELYLESTGSWDCENAAKIVLANGNIIYHDSRKIYYYNLKTGEQGVAVEPELEENELIYGLSYANKEFCYATRGQGIEEEHTVYRNVPQTVEKCSLPWTLFSIPVESIKITGEKQLLLTMENGTLKGEKTQLKVEILPENATDKRILRWESSNTEVAVVDINGTVRAAGPGEAVISAVTYDGGVTADFKVSVLHNGPITKDGKTVYYENGVKLSNQFYKEDGQTYYLGEDGTKLTDWQTVGGNTYYLNENGQVQTGWQTISEKKYYFNPDGVMVAGWRDIAGKRYYFDKNGVMKSDAFSTIAGKKYYFAKDGVMATGFKTISGSKYYFDKNGVMATGFKTINKKKYYFDKKGVMQTGFKTIKKKKYYFNKKGVMQTGFKTIKKKKYYFDKKGVMQTGFKTIKKKKYYFNDKGVMQTGWQTINGRRYYFNKKGVMQTGVVSIKGISYYFAPDGHFVS